MSRGGLLIAALAVVLATTLAYAGGFTDEYVYDDVRFVERNPSVTEGAPLGAYFTDPSTQTGDGSHEGIWRPVRTLSYRIVAAAGGGARGQRVVNFAIHLANGALVFGILALLLPSAGRGAALIGAAVFLLHPAASEPVGWISGRGDLLATTGILGTCLLWLRGRTGFGVFVFLLALLAKESAIVLLLILPMLEWFRGGWSSVRGRLPALGWYAFFAFFWITGRMGVLESGFAQGEGRGLEFGVLAATTLSMALYYLRALLFPAGLTFELRLPTALDAPIFAVLGLFATALLVWGALRFRHAARPIALAILWFAAVLLPVTFLQILFPLKILVANRFLYPAIFALALVLAWAFSRHRRVAFLVVLVVAAFVPLTAARARAFGSNERLWNDVIERDPRNPVGLAGAGFVAARKGNWARAAELLRRSSTEDLLHPGVAATHGEAMEHLASELPPDSAEQFRYVKGALESYHLAIQTWMGGSREDRRLYRLTLANAAWVALVVGRLDLATQYIRAVTASDDPLPPPGPGRELFVRRLGALAAEFEKGGETEIARSLTELRATIQAGDAR